MTAILTPPLVFQGVLPSGIPAVGGLLSSYVAGSSTPQATYTDSTMGTPNANPVVLNGYGQANVWLDPTKVYKFVLTDAAGNTLYTVDQVQGSLTAAVLTQAFVGNILYPVTGNETAASVVPTNLFVPSHVAIGEVLQARYGLKYDGSTLDDTGWVNSIAVANQLVVAGSAGIRIVGLPGTSQISAQLIFPNGVSFRGAGGRSTIIRVASTFTALTATVADSANTGGAIRIGAPGVACFGVTLEDFLLELGSVTSVATIGIGSSTINDCGLRNVTVNNFISRGVQIIGGSFGGDGYTFDDVQCFKANSGGSGGIAFDLQSGTYPCNLRTCQVVGHSGNPLTTGYSWLNMPGTMTSCNIDGAGLIAATDGILIGPSTPAVIVDGFVSNGTTNAVHITSSGVVAVAGLWAANGTNSILDSGGTGSVAKTLTQTFVPFYGRAPSSPSILEQLQMYGNLRIAVSGLVGISLDIAGAIGTGRYQVYVGDGTGGSTSGDSYETGSNNNKHFGYVGFYLPNPGGGFQANSGTYAGTGVPSNSNGNNGDYYFRSDTPGTANQRIYVKSAGSWVGIV